MGLMRTEMWQKLHGSEMRKGGRMFGIEKYSASEDASKIIYFLIIRDLS